MTATVGGLAPHGSLEHPALGRRAVRAAALSLAGQIGGVGLKLAATAALARILAPEDYGVFAMVAVVSGFAATIGEFGLTTTTIQQPNLSKAETNVAFWFNLAASVAVGAVVLAISPVLGAVFDEERVASATRAMSIVFPLAGLGTQQAALLRRNLRFGVVAAIDLSAAAIGVGAALGVALGGGGYWSLVTQQIAQSGAGALFAWSASEWRPTRPRLVAGSWSTLRRGAHFTSFNVLRYLARNFDNALIGKFFGAAALGVYSRAYQLYMLPLTQVTYPLSNVALPALSRLSGSPSEYRKAYLRAAESVAVVTLPAFATLIACADWVVLIALGPRWSQSVPIFRILGVVGLVQPITSSFWWLFTSQGRARDMATWGAVTSLTAIASFCVGLPWGVRGVAISYAVAEIGICTPVGIILTGARGPVGRRDLWSLFMFSAVAAGVAAVGAGVRQCVGFATPWVGVIAVTMVSILVTGAALGSTKRGREALRNFAGALRLLGRDP